MESDCIPQIYQHSIKEHNIRLRPFIVNGDSNSFRNVEKAIQYGFPYPIEKEECIRHITKRMKTNLRELLKTYKGMTLSDVIG